MSESNTAITAVKEVQGSASMTTASTDAAAFITTVLIMLCAIEMAVDEKPISTCAHGVLKWAPISSPITDY